MVRHLWPIAAALAAVPAWGQQAPAAPVAPVAPPVTPAPRPEPRTILFVGNSFTQGAHSAVRNWQADTVTDLNGGGYGGVPALFKRFTQEAGLDYAVSLETQGGKSLGFHYDERRQLFDRPWDVVVLQEFSTLSRARPGDPTDHIRDVGRLSALLRGRNPAVLIHLMATWTRADEVYRPEGHWYGQPVARMAEDLRAAADRATAETAGIAGVLPVGQAWNRAFASGVADPNPYDGTAFGQVDLWTYDHYHGSIYGYYLEALVVFGRITGVDPTVLGRDETAADELGISDDQAAALQAVAQAELASTRQLR
jgi:hypothetical protein